MTREIAAITPPLYDTDYQLWLDKTVSQLKSLDFHQLDLANLIEELESLGRSEKQAISSYLIRLCEHLLKIQYWDAERDRCFRAWNVEVANFRLQIQARLEVSPSLNVFLQGIFFKQYRNGRKLFRTASELDSDSIPLEPEFSLEQALEDDWLPYFRNTQDGGNG